MSASAGAAAGAPEKDRSRIELRHSLVITTPGI